jgi:hypothetical protein
MLEMQKSLLQNIATRENTVKGVDDEDGGMEASKDSANAQGDLEVWKRRMA